MLISLRSKGASWMIKILFGFLILSFAAWGVPDLYQAIQPPATAASVGDTDISAEELRRAVDTEVQRLQQSLQGQWQPEFVRQFGIVDRALESLIERKMIEIYAGDLGLVVPDDVLDRALKSNPQLVNAQGNIDPNRLAALQRELGLNEGEFTAAVRRDILSGHLLRAVTAGVQVPKSLAETIYAYRNEQRVAQTLLIPDSGVAEAPTPDDAAIAQFHKDNADRYQAPEYRALTVVRLTPADHAANIAIGDDVVKAEYDARKSEFDIPETRLIVQAVLPDEAAAKALADKVKQGTPFAEATRAASGADPLDVGTFTQKDLQQYLGNIFADAAASRQVTDALFAAAAGAAVDPVKGPIGWHVLSVGKVVPPSLTPLDSVRDKLRHEIALRQATDDLVEVANQLDDELGAGTPLAEAARKLGLTASTVPAVDRTGKDPNGKAIAAVDNQVLNIAFNELKEGDESPLTDTGDYGFVVVHVDGVQEAATQPLEAVRDKVIGDWQAAERRKAADAKAQAVVDRIKAGIGIGRIAHEMGQPVLVSQPFTRGGGDPAAQVAGPLAEKLFAVKSGEVVSGRAPADDGTVVAALVEVKPADLASSREQIDQLAQTLGRSMSGDIYQELSAGLRESIGVTKDQDLVDSLYQ
jgi:peptidyl-prolyl cis-trans isomerase D